MALHTSIDISLLDKLSAEKSRRIPSHRRIAIHPYHPSTVLPNEQLALSGTVTIFFGRHGSPLLKEVQDAVQSRNGIDRKVAQQIYNLFSNRKKVSLEDAVHQTHGAPVIAEIRYGGRTLVENITLPSELEIGVIVLPFNGGDLDALGLQWIEFKHPHVESGLDVYAVFHQPVLTPAEAAALKLVPPEEIGLNIGDGPGSVACSVVILTVAVVVEVAVVAVTYAITGSDRRFNAEISAEAIAALGPVGTANALLNMRQSILSGGE